MAIKWNIVAVDDSGHESYPGDGYSDVEVAISRDPSGEWWKISIKEAWGSNQGYLEEHGSIGPIVARDRDYDTAKAEATAQALAAGVTEKDLFRAFGRVESQDEFEEALMGGSQASESEITIRTVDGDGHEVPPQPPSPQSPKAPSQGQEGPDI